MLILIYSITCIFVKFGPCVNLQYTIDDNNIMGTYERSQLFHGRKDVFSFLLYEFVFISRYIHYNMNLYLYSRYIQGHVHLSSVSPK